MIHVVVPMLDEAGNVDALLGQVRERIEPLGVPYRIVVVDDGSTDGTGDLCRRAAAAGAPVTVLAHATNLGPGAAFRTGFLHVLGTAGPADLVVTLEGDQTSDAALSSGAVYLFE